MSIGNIRSLRPHKNGNANGHDHGVGSRIGCTGNRGLDKILRMDVAETLKERKRDHTEHHSQKGPCDRGILGNSHTGDQFQSDDGSKACGESSDD